MKRPRSAEYIRFLLIIQFYFREPFPTREQEAITIDGGRQRIICAIRNERFTEGIVFIFLHHQANAVGPVAKKGQAVKYQLRKGGLLGFLLPSSAMEFLLSL